MQDFIFCYCNATNYSSINLQGLNWIYSNFCFLYLYTYIFLNYFFFKFQICILISTSKVNVPSHIYIIYLQPHICIHTHTHINTYILSYIIIWVAQTNRERLCAKTSSSNEQRSASSSRRIEFSGNLLYTLHTVCFGRRNSIFVSRFK